MTEDLQRDQYKAEQKKCNVCGEIEGEGCTEVFGEINGTQYGCSACIGVTHFPKIEQKRP